jgi:hypothetical protein
VQYIAKHARLVGIGLGYAKCAGVCRVPLFESLQ